jgi:hypothetical protein
VSRAIRSVRPFVHVIVGSSVKCPILYEPRSVSRSAQIWTDFKCVYLDLLAY